MKKGKWWVKVLTAVLISSLLGVLVEGAYEWYIRSKIVSQGQETKIEGIDWSHMVVKGGISKDGKVYFPEGGKITVRLKNQYVNKLVYSYEAEEHFLSEIQVETKDLYGNDVMKTIQDYSSPYLPESVTNINGVVKNVIIKIPAGVSIKSIAVNNQLGLNKYRILYVAAITCLLILLYLFKRELSDFPEVIFLMISLTIGVLIILLSPTKFMGWDEHIHFYKTFDYFESGKVEWTEAEFYQYLNWESFDQSAFQSRQEKAMQIQYLNFSDNTYVYEYEKASFSVSQIGYFHMAVLVKLLRMLGVPFYYVLLAGKLMNLFVYSILLTFAIRWIPVMKRTVMTIGLMPTPMMLASTYSYDAVLIGFIFLGTALLIYEFYYADRKIRPLNCLMIPLCFAIGSCPKAIYIPLVLSFLFLPASKFKSRKTEALWKSVAMTVCILLLMTFVMPSVSGEMKSDTRGGNTDVSKQMALIFSQPISYFRVFLKNFCGTANNYLTGIDGLANMAYAGYHKMYGAVIILWIVVFFTEPRGEIRQKRKDFLRKYKIPTLILTAGVVGMIWTALYLSFTEVGQEVIEGVQGRYYIPLMISMLLMFYSDKIRTTWKKQNYNMVLSCCIIFLWHIMLYSDFLMKFCN
ncbi:MAG: DUF2142 domain-containing protein [Eubacterium sp.]|nr:DUF2142 domain-containing protein [Eubacterium sp.]